MCWFVFRPAEWVTREGGEHAVRGRGAISAVRCGAPRWMKALQLLTRCARFSL